MNCLLVVQDALIGNRLRDLLTTARGGWVCQVSTPSRIGESSASFNPQVAVVEVADVEASCAAIREIKELLECPVLAVGPALDPKTILRVVREGASQFIDVNDIDNELLESLLRWRREARAVARGRVISVLSAGNGCGASSIAVNLAASMAEKSPTALLDFQMEAGDLTALLNLNPKNTIADFCSKHLQIDDSMFDACFCIHDNDLRVLAAPLAINDLAKLNPQGVRKAVHMCRNRYTYVIADLGVPFREEHTQTLYQSDIIVLALRWDVVSLRQAVRVLNHVKELGTPVSKIRVVVNRFRRNADIQSSDVASALGIRPTTYVPEDPKRFRAAINTGRPIVMKSPKCRASKNLRRLATSLNGVATTEAKTAQPSD